MLTEVTEYTLYNNTVISKLQCKLQFNLQLFVQFKTITMFSKLQLAKFQFGKYFKIVVNCTYNCNLNLPWFSPHLFLYRSALLRWLNANLRWWRGTPTRGAGTAFQPVPAEFNHWGEACCDWHYLLSSFSFGDISVKLPLYELTVSVLSAADGLSQFVSEIRAVLELPVMTFHVPVCDDARDHQCTAVLYRRLTPDSRWHQQQLNRLMGTLKPQSNGPLYSNTVIGTLAVDGWAAAFGTAMRGLGGLRLRPVPSLYQM